MGVGAGQSSAKKKKKKVRKDRFGWGSETEGLVYHTRGVPQKGQRFLMGRARQGSGSGTNGPQENLLCCSMLRYASSRSSGETQFSKSCKGGYSFRGIVQNLNHIKEKLFEMHKTTSPTI